MVLLVIATCLWVNWGVTEMFYEGWWGPWSVRLPYLVPGASCLTLSVIAAVSPLVGGWLLVGIGGGFTAWWWSRLLPAGIDVVSFLSVLPVSGFIVLAGGMLLFEARQRTRWRVDVAPPVPSTWFRRNLRYLLVAGLPLLVAAVTAACWFPLVNGRLDDGQRDAVLIEGNCVRLVWAPAGPGWSEGLKGAGGDPRSGFPSWDEIALYGLPPAGFGLKAGYENRHATAEEMREYGMFRYLSADGLTLMAEPQDIWRMPTVDESVRSLVRDGKSAGCAWDGKSYQVSCLVLPDKETPLWAADRSPIYYWADDEYDQEDAYYVGYRGRVAHQPKSWGNPRHGYRFVREP